MQYLRAVDIGMCEAPLTSHCFPHSAEVEQEEETAREKLQRAFKKVGDKLSEWGVLSPRLMLAGGGLFMTLSNWGLLPAVCHPLLCNYLREWSWLRSEYMCPVLQVLLRGCGTPTYLTLVKTILPEHFVETGHEHFLEAIAEG
jgi:hypothetical protein